MKLIILFSGAAIALSISSLAAAEPRSGFYLSGGLGAHSMFYNQSFDGSDVSSDYLGVLTSIKIGWHLSPQWALYYQREAAFFNVGAEDPVFQDSLYVTGMAGLGTTYFFRPDVNSMYLEVGAGFGDIADTSGSYDGVNGLGLMFGFGYEFSEHFQAGFVSILTRIEDDTISGLEYQTATAALKLELKL